MQVVTRQLSVVKFDACFITTCPLWPLLPADLPTYPASCLPDPDERMPYLNAMHGRWPVAAGTGTADGIRAALTEGDPPLTEGDLSSQVAPCARPSPRSSPRVPALDGTPAAAAVPAADSGADADVAAAEDKGAQHSLRGPGTDASEPDGREDAARDDEAAVPRAAAEETDGWKDPVHEDEGQTVVSEHGRHETVAGDEAVQRLSVPGGVTLDTQDGMRQAWPVRVPTGGGVFVAFVLLILGVLRYRARGRAQKVA